MPLHPRRVILRFLTVLLLVISLTISARPAPAAKLTNSDPMAIISAVNALRATQGLPPYTVDQSLMSYALEHSRYQASLHNATHQHSDGTTVWQHGMDENIAVGMLGQITPEYAVYTIWSDPIHMKTMIGYATGSVGAGVSDDGADEYYTLDVRPGSAVSSSTRPKGTQDPNATPTKIVPIVPLLTVTPRYDRWMIHTVGYGQSLWAVAIAYGVKMDQIRDWNSMAADSIDIYAGQKLYIIAPPNIWPTLTPSPVGAVAAGQTVTPGWSITEEPVAATEKAAYQTAAAQTEAPPLENSGAPGTAVSVVQATEPPPWFDYSDRITHNKGASNGIPNQRANSAAHWQRRAARQLANDCRHIDSIWGWLAAGNHVFGHAKAIAPGRETLYKFYQFNIIFTYAGYNRSAEIPLRKFLLAAIHCICSGVIKSIIKALFTLQKSQCT